MRKRLMLGKKYDEHYEPSLLVEVKSETDDGFLFWVVNGAWDGDFARTSAGSDEGLIYFGRRSIKDSPNQKFCVLSDNQDRLRGDYQDVFNNWENENYVGPEQEPVSLDLDDYLGDDIPF